NLLFHAHVEQIRRPHQLHATFERLEFCDFLEGRQKGLVGGGEEIRIYLQRAKIERRLAAFHDAEEVFPRLERSLEQIVEAEQAAVGVHQFALHFEQRQRLQRRRQGRQRPVDGQLPRANVDGDLRLDGRDGLAVAARNEEAFDLNVAQDLGQIAVVGRKQGLEDLPVA